MEFSEARDITLRVGSESLSASFSAKGFLKSMSTGSTENFPVHLEFRKYGAARGGERSGAYLFLPDGIATPFTQTASSTVLVMNLYILQTFALSNANQFEKQYFERITFSFR